MNSIVSIVVSPIGPHHRIAPYHSSSLSNNFPSQSRVITYSSFKMSSVRVVQNGGNISSPTLGEPGEKLRHTHPVSSYNLPLKLQLPFGTCHIFPRIHLIPNKTTICVLCSGSNQHQLLCSYLHHTLITCRPLIN